MKLGNLGEFKTPTGQSGNLFSIRSWIAMIVGAFALLIAWAIATNLFSRARGYAPAPAQSWLNPVPLTQAPPQAQPVARGPNFLS